MDGSPLHSLLNELGLDPPATRRVLVVDDEIGVLLGIEALLDEMCEVHTALGGAEALETVAALGDVDVVLTDQRMPAMTGVELLAQLASEDAYRMVLTAYTDVDPIVAAVNRGSVDRFLLKPWNPEDLRRAVQEGLHKSAQRKALRIAGRALAQRHTTLSRSLKDLERIQGRLYATQRLATLGWMTSGIVEEIRGLLGGMMVLTDAAGTQDDDPAIQQAAIRANEVLSKLTHLLRDVYRFAEQAPPEISPAWLDTQSFLEDVATQFGQEQNQAEISIHVAESIPRLHADGAHLTQALLALLRNAWRAGESETPIEIRVHDDAGDCPCIEVVDQGCGMTPDVLQQATSPFFSAFQPPGLGMGLAIGRLVAEAHGGRLALLQNADRGTTAQLWLSPTPLQPDLPTAATP